MGSENNMVAVLGLLREARWYVNDSLEAHEHSDGRDLLNRIDAALAGRASISGSMVAVPVEPTEAMIAAGATVYRGTGPVYVEDIWAAMMIAAARLASPQPDAQQGEGRTLQLDEGAEAAPPHCDWAEIMPDGSERLLIAAADPTTPSLPALDAATIERCAKVAEGWSDPAFATMHENRCFAAIAAAIRALPNAEKRHG